MAPRGAEGPAKAARTPELSEAPAALDPSRSLAPSSPHSRLVFLPPDWLPLALIVGDAFIAAISVPAGYWVDYANAPHALRFGPYLAAIPFVVAFYLFALAVTGQYRSWRGRTLVDQL